MFSKCLQIKIHKDDESSGLTPCFNVSFTLDNSDKD